MSSGTQFSVTQYGQDRLVMDWFALQDPFKQFLPLKVTNNYSGRLFFTGNLASPPAWYSNYSGIVLSGTAASGGVAAGGNNTLLMSWDVSVSGQIDKSGPNTDTLTLQIFSWLSGFKSGAYVSGSITVTNVLYNRYSGVIKVFGDNYSNDQPLLTLTQGGVGGLAAGQAYSFATSYFLSGWESDVGAKSTLTTNSGAINLTWTGVAGVTQYAIWRWSGSTDFTNTNPMSGTMDLVAVVSGTSMTDSGITALQTGMFRHQNWVAGAVQWASDTEGFLSPPASRSRTQQNGEVDTHLYHLGKNMSGVLLLGPFYVTIHKRDSPGTTTIALRQAAGSNNTTSGSIIADSSVFGQQVVNAWNRFGFYVSGVSSGAWTSTSGLVWVQFFLPGPGASNTWRMDDVYVVAVS